MRIRVGRCFAMRAYGGQKDEIIRGLNEVLFNQTDKFYHTIHLSQFHLLVPFSSPARAAPMKPTPTTI